MTATTDELLAQLLELTPLPPGDGEALALDAKVEIEPLLAAFEASIARRAEILAQLAPALVPRDAEHPLVREIQRREAAWQAALTTALRLVGDQRHGTDQLRAYAPPA